jgi:hypothetical protein
MNQNDRLPINSIQKVHQLTAVTDHLLITLSRQNDRQSISKNRPNDQLLIPSL